MSSTEFALSDPSLYPAAVMLANVNQTVRCRTEVLMGTDVPLGAAGR
jgi:hypothetical protein